MMVGGVDGGVPHFAILRLVIYQEYYCIAVLSVAILAQDPSLKTLVRIAMYTGKGGAASRIVSQRWHSQTE